MTNGDWTGLFVDLFLIALVDALSPVRVAFILLLLSGSRPVLRGTAFIIGIGAFNIAFGLLIGKSVDTWPTFNVELGRMGLIIGLLLGVVLLIFAVRTWHTKPPKAGEGDQSSSLKMPAFLSRFSNRVLHGGVGLVFVGGMVMELFSIKSLVLFSLGVKRILEAQLPPSSAVIVLLIFVVLDLCEMIVPTVIFAVSPSNSARRLSEMSQWLLHYSYPILAVAEGALALYFIFESIAGLLS